MTTKHIYSELPAYVEARIINASAWLRDPRTIQLGCYCEAEDAKIRSYVLYAVPHPDGLSYSFGAHFGHERWEYLSFPLYEPSKMSEQAILTHVGGSTPIHVAIMRFLLLKARVPNSPPPGPSIYDVCSQSVDYIREFISDRLGYTSCTLQRKGMRWSVAPLREEPYGSWAMHDAVQSVIPKVIEHQYRQLDVMFPEEIRHARVVYTGMLDNNFRLRVVKEK